MHNFCRLSRRGHTIIFSIHQPRYGIFRLFDTLHLLSRGQTVYHGPANEALNYFSDLGKKIKVDEDFEKGPQTDIDLIVFSDQQKILMSQNTLFVEQKGSIDIYTNKCI